jgi:hypothetical protein
MEGAYAQWKNKTITLSDQELVDCTYGANDGCVGGDVIH